MTCFIAPVRARTYEPTTGRWLSKDPLGFVDGPNLNGAYFVPDGFEPCGAIIVTAGEPKGKTSCGQVAERSWKFVLSKKYPESGWIVQKVAVECAINVCDSIEYPGNLGKDCKTCECEIPEPDRFEYWEAWRVNAKELVSQEWSTRAKNWHDSAGYVVRMNTCGFVTQDGVVRLFLDLEIAKFGNGPAVWPRGKACYRHDWRCTTSTINLRSTAEEPAW